LAREPLQELRVGRRFATRAKVVRSRNDALAEGVLPEPVDQDAGQESTGARAGPGQPAGQGGATGTRRPALLLLAQDGRGCRIAENTDEPGGQLRSRRFVVAALQPVRGWRRPDVVDGLDLAVAAPAGFKLRRLPAERGELVLVVGDQCRVDLLRR